MRKIINLNYVLFIVLFSWISFVPQPIQGRYLYYIIILLAIFLFLFSLTKNKNKKRLFGQQDVIAGLFLLSLWAGTVNAIDKKIAYKTYFEITLIFLFLFYIGKGMFVIDNNSNRVSAVICTCSLTVAIIGLFELYFGKNILYENFIHNYFYERYKLTGRPMSTQLNPVILGSYLLGCFPFGFFLFKNKSVYLRRLGIISLLICAFVIILTFSRGVLLGFIAMIIFYLWQGHKKRLLQTFAILSAGVVIFCSFQVDENLKRFGLQRFIAGSYDSIFSEYRSERVKMTLKMLLDHPFLGSGLNHFRVRFDEYCSKENINETDEFRIPDNMYLTFLAETGLIGSAGFLLFIIFLLRAGLKEVRKQSDDKREILLVFLAALIGLLINMGAYELFYWHNPLMLFCLLCGFIAAKTNINISETRPMDI